MSVASSTRAAKRQRESDDSGSQNLTSPESETESQFIYRRHPKYWFGTGDLVVVAESIPIPMAFRIMRDVIVKNSPVFARQVGQVPTNPTYDGCPIFRFAETAAHFEAAWMWMFYKYFDLSLPKQIDLDCVIAFYQLENTYDLAGCREEAINRLRACYPPTFDALDRLSIDQSPDRPIAFSYNQELSIAVFCASSRIQPVLPAVLYRCCYSQLRDIELMGDFLSRNTPTYTVNGKAPRRWLSERLARGYPLLCTAYVDRIRELLRGGVSPACVTQAPCREILRLFAEHLLDQKMADGNRPPYLHRLPPTYFQYKRPCQDCWAFHVKRWDAELQKTWSDLPKIFGLIDETQPAAA